MTKHQFTYRLDSAFYVSAAREVLWRRYGGWTTSFIFVGVAAIAGLLTGSYRGFWSFCLGSASLYCFYLIQMYRQIRSVSEKLTQKQISVMFDENGCTFESDGSRVWLSWSILKPARRYKRGVLLERVDSFQSILIPSRALTDEALKFLDQSIKQSGLIKAHASSQSN